MVATGSTRHQTSRAGGARPGAPRGASAGGAARRSGPAPAVRRRVLLAVIGVGLVVTLGFWWRQAGGGQVGGAAATLTSAGRLAGLIGGYLLLVQTLLMSRVPVIERAASGMRQSRWHRDLGAYLLAVVSLHVLLITLGYAATARTGVWREVRTLLTTYRDLISATIAFGIMSTVGVIAVRAIRKRLPYGLWHGMHSAAYLVLLLVYGHQFADGQQFVLDRAARLFWASLYFIVVGALIYGRLVVPLRLNLRHRLRVRSVTAQAPGVASIYVTGRHLDELPAHAGQYARWRFLTAADWWRSHPYSLSAAPNGRWLRLTVKAVGDQSRRLHGLTPGTRVWIDAPTGEFTTHHARRRAAVLIAGGTGITPVRALAEVAAPGSVIIYRAHSADELLFQEELDRLASSRRLRIVYVVGSRTDPQPARALSRDGLRRRVPDIAERDVYVCGPPGLTDRVLEALAAAGVPGRQVHVDGFEL